MFDETESAPHPDDVETDDLETDDVETDVSGSAEEEEFEEITSDEVDRVVEVLEKLAETVQSENIRVYLEEATNNVYYLVYEDDGEDEEDLADAA